MKYAKVVPAVFLPVLLVALSGCAHTKANHYGMNESDEPAVIIVVYAGTEGNPITVLNQ